MYDRFQSASAGNVQETRKFATQLVAVAIPTAAARTRLGNISEINTQTTGPQDRAKKNTNAFAPISAIVAFAPVSVATDSPISFLVTVAEWKQNAAVPSEMAIPAEPTNNSGFRPTRSMTAMATNVPTMLTKRSRR